MNKMILPATILLVMAQPGALAGQSDEFQEVIVSATRTEQNLNDILASASVITSQDIARLQAVDLVDVFSLQPGADITRAGGRGAVSSLQLRGTYSDHTLMLINGQRFNSATLGVTQFQFVDPEQVERIEIVRGSRSALYGSDAIGGVIQVFTKQGLDTAGTYVKAEVGSNDLWKLAAGTSGGIDAFRYGLGVSYLDTVGIDNRIDDTAFNADKDGYENDSFNASLGYTFDNDIDISMTYFQTNSRTEHDSQFNPAGDRPYAENTIYSASVKLEIPVTENWKTLLNIGNSVDDSDNFNDFTKALSSHFRSTRDSFYWQSDLTVVEGHKVTFGYDYYDEKIKTSTDYEDVNGHPVNSRNNEAVYGQYQASVGAFDAVFGLREDDNESFGAHTTGSVAFGYQLNENHKLIASWAEGYKAPTFNDLYWPAGPFSAGNPDVVSEESENYEVSLRGNYNAMNWSLALFRNTINNLIDWAPGSDFVWRPSNIASAKIKGGELVVDFTVDGWFVSALASYTDPTDEISGNTLTNRAKKKFVLDVSRSFQAWQVGLTMKAQSERSTSTTAELPGYGIIGLQVGYEVTEKLRTQLKFDNLLDKDYQLNDGFNEDGLNWLLGVTYSL